MTLGQRWAVAVVCAFAVLAALLLAVEGLALYGGRPIVNNPRPAALTVPAELHINTLYIEHERTHR